MCIFEDNYRSLFSHNFLLVFIFATIFALAAGSGANVTLGIPRLREIIMTASKDIKTPTMSVPLHEGVSEKNAIQLTRNFLKLTLEVTLKIKVKKNCYFFVKVLILHSGRKLIGLGMVERSSIYLVF